MAVISMDLRVRIFEARQSGDPTPGGAEWFAVSRAFVRRLMQRHRETGSLVPSAARRGPALADHADRLRQWNAERPNRTPAESRDRLGLAVASLPVWRMLRRLGLTFEKSPSGRASGTARTSGRPAGSGRR